MRRLFALAVLLIHALLMWWVMSGMPPQLQHELPADAYFIQWIPLTDPIPPKPALAYEPRELAARSSSIRALPEIADQPEFPEAPAAAPTETLVPAPASAAPKVDWAQEGTAAAQRTAKRSDNGQQKTFSALPETAPEPCVPKESSMKWNGKEDRRVTWAGPLPVFKIGKRCVVTIGAFACSLGELPEPNSHLLDDMRAADRPSSSVPDPHFCD